MKDKHYRVLMELRPCLEGVAGIPQETRLLFAALRDIESIETHGLINHPIRVLTPGIRVGARFSDRRVHRKYGIMSRFIISQRMTPYRTSSIASAISSSSATVGPRSLPKVSWACRSAYIISRERHSQISFGMRSSPSPCRI